MKEISTVYHTKVGLFDSLQDLLFVNMIGEAFSCAVLSSMGDPKGLYTDVK